MCCAGGICRAGGVCCAIGCAREVCCVSYSVQEGYLHLACGKAAADFLPFSHSTRMGLES